MNHLEQIKTLAEIMENLVRYDSRVVIELTHSKYHSGNYYLISARVKQDLIYSAEIELFSSALDINFELIKKHILKLTTIRNIHPNTLKTGYIFRK